MSVTCSGFKEFTRMPGSCVKCGRVELAHSGSTEQPGPVARNIRTPEFETEALRWIAKGSANPSIPSLVVDRLDWGDREYGDLFNRRGDDGIKEAADEAIDGISWALLHLQNREEDGDVRELLMRACRAFAEAHRELAAALHLASS
jgi:hypothetical protein